MSKKWKPYKVTDFAEVVGGGTPNTETSEFWNGDIPWITPKDLSNHKERRISKGERSISVQGLKNSSARIVPPNAVLLTSRAPVGYLAISQNELATNQGFRSLIVKEGFSSEFVYYLLLNNIDYLKQHASGSTFQELSGGTLKNLEFQLPDFPVQNKIAKILSSLDTKIELNQNMNHTLESICQALYKEWFVDFNFPARYRKPDTESNGVLPQGWQMGVLSDVADIVGGGTPSTIISEYFSDDGIPWITPKDLSGYIGKFIEKGSQSISELGLKKSGAQLIPAGSVLFSSRAPIGYTVIARNPVTTNQGFKSLVPKKHFYSEFLYQFLIANTADIKSRASGTTFLEVSGGVMKNIPLIIPDEALVEYFSIVTASINNQIYQNQKEIESLKEIRDTLIPKLLSGEIEVPVDGQ